MTIVVRMVCDEDVHFFVMSKKIMICFGKIGFVVVDLKEKLLIMVQQTDGDPLSKSQGKQDDVAYPKVKASRMM
ncbi:hypothetical protein P5673_023401 [Acropora cervicornis]|uniref:Uncharacterized protein n=1 Tax=Acropora cervicornis TaxID=6130 RepID=A0AAD9Q642_ACRCE|nr:hypothetical protein P5673_023401 [Acropora cervicornis]